MPSRSSIRLIVLSLFFLSGISGLVYQIVWTRMLVLVFGNTLLATSTVLSAFMAGLAAGSYFLGRFIDHRPRRLIRLYALLEAGIGFFALLFPLLLASAAPFYTWLYQILEGNLLLLNLARFSICCLLIFIPTFMMGGTLPILIKRFSAGKRALGYQTGLLYGLNTAGAMAGAVAAGYWLLRTLGMQRTTWVAVAINLGVAIVAWLLTLKPAQGEPAIEGAENIEEPVAVRLDYSKATVQTVLVGAGLSGFCALAYEVLWTRMLNLFLNNNIYSFTAVLVTFLAGIALGSLLFSAFLSRSSRPVQLFASLQIGIGVLAYATPFLMSTLQEALFSNRSEVFTLLKTTVIMIGPTLLMGIALPLAIQICQLGQNREGSSVGTVYAVNTIGAILGAFAAGFMLVPSIGLHYALIGVASINILAGFLALVSLARRARRPALAGAFAVLLPCLFIIAPPSFFRDLYLKATPDSEILHYKEGKVVNVVVYDFIKAGYKDLHLNGIEEASSRLWHVQLFKMLGVLPVMVHQDPDDALMIAFGAGMSAGACAQLVESLDCVDLNPDIQGPAEIFRHENLDVIDNPKLNLIVNDGRNALLLKPKKYSIIISDATNPKMFDSWTLYTREFYELTKSRLKPNGVFAQWVVHPIPGDSIKVILNTFRTVYPHASFWCIYGSSQCLMLGTQERLEIDYQDLSRRLEPVFETTGLAEYGISTPAKFLSFLLLGEDEMGKLLEGYPRISTDDLPSPQFQMGKANEGIRSSLELLRYQDTILPYLKNTNEATTGLVQELEAYALISRRLNLGFLLNSRNEFLKAAQVARSLGMPVDSTTASALRHDTKRRQYFERRADSFPDDPGSYNSLGYIHWMDGSFELSIGAFNRALELQPAFANARANLAQVLIDAGLLNEAGDALLDIRRENPTPTVLAMARNRLALIRLLRKTQYEPDNPIRYMALSQFHARSGELARAITTAEKGAELAPGDLDVQLRLAELYEDLEVVSLALDRYGAAARLAPLDSRIKAKEAQLRQLNVDREAHRAWLNSAEIVLPDAAADSKHYQTCTRARAKWSTHDFESSIETTNLEEAVRLFEQTIDADPGHLHAYLDAATILEALEEYGRAAEVLRKAIAAHPGEESLPRELRRLELLDGLENGRWDQVARQEGWLEVGRLFHTRGEVERAIASSLHAMREGADGGADWLSLARGYLDAGKYSEATGALEEALKRTTDPSGRRSIADQLLELQRMVSRLPELESSAQEREGS